MDKKFFQFITVIVLATISSQCSSLEKRDKAKNKSVKAKKSANANDINYKVVTEPQGKLAQNVKRSVVNTSPIANANTRNSTLLPIGTNATDLETQCRQLLEMYLPVYMQLAQKLGPLKESIASDSPARKILTLSSSSCDFKDSQANVVQVFRAALQNHNQKIGLILPLSAQAYSGGSEILAGMRKSFSDAGKNFEQSVVVKDSVGNLNLLEQTIAQIVFNEQVAIIIGGATFEEAQILSQWGERLRLPVILLSSKFSPKPGDAYSFQVSPTQEVLAAKLADVCAEKNFKRVAVLRPRMESAEAFTKIFSDVLRSRNLRLAQDIAFQSGNFDSMETAAKTLFRVRDGDRRGEFVQLTRKMRQEAKDKGYGFNPSMVMLPPEINFDVLFIPDNFKMVRHFVQIFKYLGVEKLQLMGNYEWRSKGLVLPYDPFLEQAIFVDFIGSYANLPSSLNVRTVGSPLFVTTEKARVYDYNLIGLHAIEIAERALQDGLATDRMQIPQVLLNLQQTDTRYFKPGNVFSAKKIVQWPAFIFEIKDKEIRLNAQLSEGQSPPASIAH